MLEYRYSVTEYDPDRPWVVLGSSRGQVTLPDDDSFFEWAQEQLAGAPLARRVRSLATCTTVAAMSTWSVFRSRCHSIATRYPDSSFIFSFGPLPADVEIVRTVP